MINIGEIIAQEDGRLNYLGCGGFGKVYRIGETPYAIKISHRGTRDSFDNEYNMARALYHCKVSVPKPFGLTRIINPETKKVVPGFLMQYVDGQTIFKIIPGELKEKVIQLRDREVAYAKRIGFIPVDEDYPENAIWHPKEEKIYLIDFALWKRR